MGQYRQWLHHRAVDQQLCAQLHLLEQELTQLQEQVTLLGEIAYTDNAIMQALAASQSKQDQVVINQNSVAEEVFTATDTPEGLREQHTETVSPALFAWSSLPNFGSQEMQEPSLNADAPAVPHPEVVLLPEDMVAFLDAHSATDPQITLPWWLRNGTTSAAEGQGPVDEQSVRTNQLVQRWLERWRRQPTDLQTTQGDSAS